MSAIFVMCIQSHAQTGDTAITTKTPIQTSAKKKFATLKVYRPKRARGFYNSYALHISNSAKADSILKTIENGDFYTIKLYTEGITILSAKIEKPVSVEIDVVFGQVYFLRCGVAMGAYAGNAKLELIENEKGEKEFDKMW